MKKVFVLTFCFNVFFNIIHAQWKQTQGPGAGYAARMIAVNNDLYVANGDFTGTDVRV